jgi:serine O-acetyltransferase
LSVAHTDGCARSFSALVDLLSKDLYRYSGKVTWKEFFKHFIITPGYKYTVWMRLCGFLKVQRWSRRTLYYLVKYILVRCRYKYGITIPEYTVIGPGFFINRFGGIYVNGDVVMGSNVNLTHGVVLGQMNRGPRAGSPVIGDRVFIGSGAKILGNIRVGSDAAIGANAVVTKDVPDGAAVGGIPAKVLSMEGSSGYVNRVAKL